MCALTYATAAPPPAPQWQTVGKDTTSVESRLAKIERLLDNQALLDLTMQFESMQKELSELRGQLEQLNFNYNQINDQQRQTYIDLDGRIQGLENKLGNLGASPQLQNSSG